MISAIKIFQWSANRQMVAQGPHSQCAKASHLPLRIYGFRKCVHLYITNPG